MPAGIDVVSEHDRLRGALGQLRRRILAGLHEPGSATTLAAELGETRQRVNYHLRELEKAGLVEVVELRQRRGRTERLMRATARTVVVAPAVVGDLAAETQDRFAADALLAVSARMLRDVAAMRERAGAANKRLITFTLEADVGFERPADIERFATRLGEALAELAAEFDSPAARRRYRIVAGGHPTMPSESE
ncbi:ArsR/SmtB family transcription factor [Allorhizocola rhizosphaerae]|uniref:ArsR/SmtB family transcription factor n=1 Tax=Allorhizocola rhizosphaerae TaxID=1872709 RepID=UPI000E3B821F|nr:winged helix-turn-helix domain-containing protein [Allorhizocola rhizosphaerae]